MSIESEITRINNNIAATYTALSAKGATMPVTENSANLASTVATVPSPDPVNKAFTVNNGVLSAPKNITFSANTFADVTSIDEYGLFQKYKYQSSNVSNPDGVLKFDNVTSIGVSGFNNAFSKCNITSISFDSLARVDKDNAFYYAFTYNDKLTSISFPALTYVKGRYVFQRAFLNCSSLASVNFPELTTITGYSCCSDWFSYCTSLTTASFPKLEAMEDSICESMFSNCSSLASVDFSALKSMGRSSIRNGFYNCTALTTISFPSLTTITQTSFIEAFTKCTNLTSIHFPAAIQTDIEATSGYDSKWGAANATVYFDL